MNLSRPVVIFKVKRINMLGLGSEWVRRDNFPLDHAIKWIGPFLIQNERTHTHTQSICCGTIRIILMQRSGSNLLLSAAPKNGSFETHRSWSMVSPVITWTHCLCLSMSICRCLSPNTRTRPAISIKSFSSFSASSICLESRSRRGMLCFTSFGASLVTASSVANWARDWLCIRKYSHIPIAFSTISRSSSRDSVNRQSWCPCNTAICSPNTKTWDKKTSTSSTRQGTPSPGDYLTGCSTNWATCIIAFHVSKSHTTRSEKRSEVLLMTSLAGAKSIAIERRSSKQSNARISHVGRLDSLERFWFPNQIC